LIAIDDLINAATQAFAGKSVGAYTDVSRCHSRNSPKDN
jgi:hypothetical protein